MKTKADIKEKFSDNEYPIYVTGRQLEVTDAMKNYAIEKLRKIEKFGGRVIDAYITMDIQRVTHTVNYLINVNNTLIKVSGETNNMYASIDQALDHLKAKLRRYIKKLHEHHSKNNVEADMNVTVVASSDLDEINDQIEEENLKKIEETLKPHVLVKKDTILLKTLNLSESIMKMELSEDPFMLYRSEEDRKIKAIYRREDGNFGIIEVEK